MTNILFFTDLDGSLLDHDDYSCAAARPALERIAAAGWPLVFVTSKTRAEVEVLRDAIGIHDAFVVENGGGIFLPPSFAGSVPSDAHETAGYRVIRLGRPYREIRDFVESLDAGLGVRGFGDMTDEEVARRTGLSSAEARLARRREFSEPFLIGHERDLDMVVARAAASGLAVTTGGRFHHLIGAEQDKGRAVRRLTELFQENSDGRLVTVAAGDGPNDVPMLENVDVPIVIPSATGRFARIGVRDHVVAPCPGSSGWNDAVLSVIDRIGLDERRSSPGARR